MKNKIITIVFIIFLITPTFLWICVGGYLNVENAENRALATRPELTLATIEEYPQDYEDYYNDHLPFKSIIVNMKTKMDYKLFKSIDSEKVLLGKDNWLFYKGAGVPELASEQPISDYQGTNHYGTQQLDLIKYNIEAVNTFLTERNIKFSILLCPNKENIYSEYIPDHIKVVNDTTKMDKLLEYLYEYSDVPVLCPEDILNEYKDTYQVYYKYDTHWNKLGGFIGAQMIIEHYMGESDTLYEYKVSVVENGGLKDLANMLNMPEEFSDDPEYYLEDYKPEIEVELAEAPDGGYLHCYTSNAQDDRTIMIICDSYSTAMHDTITKDFKKVIFIHRNWFNQSYIDSYQPDMVVYELVERTTDALMNMTNIFEIK